MRRSCLMQWLLRSGGASPPDGAGEPETRDVIPADVRTALIGSFYPRFLAQAESARNRAQAGYGIASAVGAALVTAGLVSDFRSQPGIVVWFGLGAIAAWLMTALAFLGAVALPAVAAEPPGIRRFDAFAQYVVDKTLAERDKIDRRLRWAVMAFVNAIVLTVVAFSLFALGVNAEPQRREARIAVTDAERGAIRSVCSPARNLAADLSIGKWLHGKLKTSTLREALISVVLDQGECSAGSSPEIEIPREDVTVVEFFPTGRRR
jgi:hypothetical protein